MTAPEYGTMRKFSLEIPEYAFLHTDERLKDNIILLGFGGSHAYGTNIPTSDTDLRGFATRTPYSICTGSDFEEVIDNQTDTVIYSFDKMLKLLSECNPNCIEILGLKPEHYFIKTELGEEILKNKDMFLSKRCIQTFGGYATQQLYRLQQKTLTALSPEEYNAHIAKVINQMKEHFLSSFGYSGITMKEQNGKLYADIESMKDVPIETLYSLLNDVGNVVKEYNKNSKRNDKAIEHGKINKHAMHLLRLYMMAIDLLEKHEIVTYREDEHDLLMDIRNGKFNEDGMMNKAFFDLLREYERRFEVAKRDTTLPDKPDLAKIKQFQYRVNSSIINNVKEKTNIRGKDYVFDERR